MAAAGGVAGMALAMVIALPWAAPESASVPGVSADGAAAATGPVWREGPRQTAHDADYYLRDASGQWAAPRCIGNGRSGPRVQPVFVHRTGSPNRYGHFRVVLQRSLRLTTGIVERSSGTRRTVRWVHDRACTPKIWQVAVPAGSTHDLDSLRSHLRSTDPRFRRSDRVYSLWVDARTSPEWSGLGGDKWSATWSSSWGFVWVDAHELMHALGAVRPGAPHATGKGHCHDGYDVMCYSDGGRTGRKRPVCRSHTAMFRLDCGDDDYFSVSPRPGSWLARNPGANLANSRFLATVAPRELPGAPAPAADVSHDGARVSWRADPGTTYDVGVRPAGAGLKWVVRDVRGGEVGLGGASEGAAVFVRAVNEAGYAPRVRSTPVR